MGPDRRSGGEDAAPRVVAADATFTSATIEDVLSEVLATPLHRDAPSP
jgi:hypothetical protein